MVFVGRLGYPVPFVLALLTTAACGDTSEPPTRVEGTQSGDCRDGVDNDSDGTVDCEDPGCSGSMDCDSTGMDAGLDAGPCACDADDDSCSVGCACDPDCDACEMGFILCDGECVDPSTNLLNCGECDRACSECDDGTCILGQKGDSCACDQAFGCEVDDACEGRLACRGTESGGVCVEPCDSLPDGGTSCCETLPDGGTNCSSTTCECFDTPGLSGCYCVP